MKKKERGERRTKEEEQIEEECVFHRVHLVLHSTGDILREIYTSSVRVPQTPWGHRGSTPPQNIDKTLQQIAKLDKGSGPKSECKNAL